MPGFADNLRRLCLAAGVPVTEMGRRLGAMPGEVVAWQAPAAQLPELHVLVRMADALGCRVDDLLEGEDRDFDHPQRRHAALIAARMGRVRTLLSQVRLARHRGAVLSSEEARLDEPALLATVDRCRAWVMSGTHDLPEAAVIESELDVHVERVRAVLDGSTSAQSSGESSLPAAEPSGVITGEPARATSAPTSAPALPTAAAGAPPPEVGGPTHQGRAAGHRSTLWAQEYVDQQHACVLVTGSAGVSVELHVDDRLLEARPCQTLDEAFEQSTAWKRTYLTTAILTLPDIPS